MRWFQSKAMVGALALSEVMFGPARLGAQSTVTMTVTVEDSRGAAIEGATAKDSAGELAGRSDAAGRLTVASDRKSVV